MTTQNEFPEVTSNFDKSLSSTLPSSPITSLQALETALLSFTKQNRQTNVIEYLPFLRQYTGYDWRSHIKLDPKNYVRNNIFSNEYFDLHIITWDVNQGSRIHDHPDNGCVFKILQGQLQETKYQRETIQEIKVTKLEENKIGYINNEIGVHQIKNDCDGVTVSLHIYSPPRQQCNYYS